MSCGPARHSRPRRWLGAAHRGLQLLGQNGTVFAVNFVLHGILLGGVSNALDVVQAAGFQLGLAADHTDAALQRRFERVGQASSVSGVADSSALRRRQRSA